MFVKCILVYILNINHIYSGRSLEVHVQHVGWRRMCFSVMLLYSDLVSRWC